MGPQSSCRTNITLVVSLFLKKQGKNCKKNKLKTTYQLIRQIVNIASITSDFI